jgi:hypothetical protein
VYENWDSFTSSILASGLPPEEWEKNDSLLNAILTALNMKPGVGNKNTVIGALKKLYKFISGDYWESGGTVLVPSDSMDKFLKNLDKDHLDASDMINSKFPARPKKDCLKCDFASVCTREPVSLEEGVEEYGQ